MKVSRFYLFWAFIPVLFVSCENTQESFQYDDDLQILGEHLSQTLSPDSAHVPMVSHKGVLVRTLGAEDEKRVYVFVPQLTNKAYLDYYLVLKPTDLDKVGYIYEESASLVATELVATKDFIYPTYAIASKDHRLYFSLKGPVVDSEGLLESFEFIRVNLIQQSRDFGEYDVPISELAEYPANNTLTIGVGSSGESASTNDYWIEPICNSPPCTGGCMGSCAISVPVPGSSTPWSCVVDCPAGMCAVCINSVCECVIGS